MLQDRKILVSCFTPTLKFKKCLEVFPCELEQQDLFPNFEFILNMNSLNNEKIRIVDRLKGKYVEVLKVVTHSEIQPLGSAWNQYISLAKAKIEGLAIMKVFFKTRISDSKIRIIGHKS